MTVTRTCVAPSATPVLLRIAGTAFLILCAVMAGQCGNSGDARATAAQAQAPRPKQAIRALLRNHDIALTLHESCANVGSEFSDTTIGDYLAGLIAEQTRTSATGRNGVMATCQPAAESGNWQCMVELARQDGENEWVRGVTFVMTPDGQMQRDSLRCTGGG